MASRRKPAVQRQDVPPDVDTRYIPIIHAVPDMTHRFVVLNHHLVGVWTHYYLERTVPCWGRDAGCVCQGLKLARTWKGYLGAFWPSAGRCILAEATIDAVRHNRSVFDPATDLRGMAMAMFRLTASKRGPVRFYAERRITHEDLAALPAPLDVMRSLYAVWGFVPDPHVRDVLAQMQQDQRALER